MKGEPALDPSKLTFSQAYGYEELPRPLKLGEIDRESRVKLWNQFYNHLVLIIDDIDFHYEEAIAAREIIRFLHTDFFVLPVNAFVLNSERIVYEYESMFMNDPFNEVFDLLLAVMRPSIRTKPCSCSVPAHRSAATLLASISVSLPDYLLDRTR